MNESSQLINSSPVFILGATKSGTSLISSLLDNHPELFVIPRESHFIQYVTGFWVDYRFRRTPHQAVSFDQMPEKMIEGVITENNDQNPLGDRPGFPGYDIERFKSYVRQHKIASYSEAFSLYAAALYFSIYNTPASKEVRIVEKSVENAEYATVLKAMFPKAKFLHIVRNPYATFTSCRKFKTLKGYPLLNDTAWSLRNSFYHLLKNPVSIKDYYVLKYEDLLHDPESMMKEISDFLGIEYLPSLTEPTLLGKNWAGNSTSKKQFTGISRTPSTSYLKEINALEIEITNKFSTPVLEKFGYEKLAAKKSPLWPVAGETPQAYIKNRITLKMI